MRVIMVGNLSTHGLEKQLGEPSVVLDGSREDVRGCALLFGKEARVVGADELARLRRIEEATRAFIADRGGVDEFAALRAALEAK